MNVVFVLGSHVRHVAAGVRITHFERTNSDAVDWVPLCRQRSMTPWPTAATPAHHSRPICAYCVREVNRLMIACLGEPARAVRPPVATIADFSDDRTTQKTTAHDRANPDEGQTWAWGDLLCQVTKVTRKYAHLEVSDGNGRWHKRQPLPLADSFELWW